jgi:uncharacterized Zn-binding protein involved in type VI secretion
MPSAVRMSCDAAGGPLMTPLQTTVFVSGSLWVVVGTPVAGHGVSPHSSPVMTQGSPTVWVGGFPACRAGDVASCGCPASPGEPLVQAESTKATIEKRERMFDQLRGVMDGYSEAAPSQIGNIDR